MLIQTPSVTGDIILFQRPQKSVNIFAQSALRMNKAKHHHVAIALYNHSLIHAMPKLGVHVLPLVKYLNENKDFEVFRHISSLDEKNSEHLEKHLRRHLLQDYSLLNTFYTSASHSFCSELAAKAYINSGMRLTSKNKSPKSVLPHDIYSYVNNSPDWINITEFYEVFYFENINAELLISASKIEQRLLDFGQQMGLNQQLLINQINSAERRQGRSGTDHTPPMDFWTNSLARRSTRHIFWYWARMIKSIIISFSEKFKRKPKAKDKFFDTDKNKPNDADN